MNEFEIIKNYFTQSLPRADVLLGIGDDAAIVSIPSGHELVLTTDTLIAGTHFPQTTSSYDIGYKSLAVNLSDLAAMGATPAWAMLALTIPESNEDWLSEFCKGFFDLAKLYDIELIGGDLTQGALSITVQAMGFVPSNQALLRSGAKSSDLIYVTGTLGDAGLALAYLLKQADLKETDQAVIVNRLNRPSPRVLTGIALRNLAHASIDISDGLVSDLGHILKASQVGAELNVDDLPISKELKDTLPQDERIRLALTAGDDYELCFTIPANKKIELEKKLNAISCHATRIGTITKELGLRLYHKDESAYHGPLEGFKHFY